MQRHLRNHEILVRSQYFVYFGVLGLVLPYFNLYCFHIGLSGYQIGVLSAVRSITTTMFPLVAAVLADRFKIRRSIYICCSIVSAAVWGLFFFSTEFVPMLLISLFYGIFYAPIISLLEAITMEVLGPARTRYGSARVWGSVSFIIVVLAMGPAIDAFGVGIMISLVFGGAVLHALLALRIPVLEGESGAEHQPTTHGRVDARMWVFLTAAFLMLVSHGAYYGFFSIHLETLGLTGTFIGAAWALASTAEILVMVRSERLFKRFSLEQVLLFSFGIAALRWLILSLANSPLVIMLSQVLHAVTYGTFHMASILYVDRLSAQASKTMGQSLNNAMTYGLGLMTGFYLNGWLYERVGSFALFAVSSAIAVAGGAVLATGVWMDQRRAGH